MTQTPPQGGAPFQPQSRVAWLVEFVWPLRWPSALLLLLANLLRLVPQDARDAYQLVAVGTLVLVALRIFFLDHEAREDRKMAARESRLLLTDRGMEALARELKEADKALALELRKVAECIEAVDGKGGKLEELAGRLRACEERWGLPRGGR
jgi:hypothetical protein